MASGGSEDFMLVAAIDFGTTFSGYAFSFKSTKDNPESADSNIMMNKNWGALLGFQSYKTPTSVLIKKSGEFVKFGFEAEEYYGHCHEYGDDDETEGDGVSPDLLLFRHFKMLLLNKKKVKLDVKIEAVDGRVRPAIDIFAHALRYLKEHMLTAIHRQSGTKPDTNLIRWVITVPAIWSEQSKQFMREAALRAGCTDTKDSRHLVIALEPEAASLCCRRLNIAQYADPDGINFPVGTKYLVLDCGGGTIDITAHQMESENRVKELYRASGGDWGGTKVDQNFIELLRSALGKEFMKKFQNKHPHEWLRFLTSFERSKKSFKPKDSKSKISIAPQFSMTSLFQEMNKGERIDQFLKRSDDKRVKFGNGTFIIKYDDAKALFDPVVKSIIEHTKELLNDKKLRGIKYILMVGGFSECAVLQDAVRANFEKKGVKVLIPSETQLAIIKGAVMFGHNPQEIATRIARYSYGCEYTPNFNSDLYDNKYKRNTSVEGFHICDKVFDCFIQKDEEIPVNKTITKSYFTASERQKQMPLPLFSYDQEPGTSKTTHTDFSGMKRLGSVTVDVPGEGMGREVELRMTLGGTEIQVEAIVKSTGEKASTSVDFLTK